MSLPLKHIQLVDIFRKYDRKEPFYVFQLFVNDECAFLAIDHFDHLGNSFWFQTIPCRRGPATPFKWLPCRRALLNWKENYDKILRPQLEKVELFPLGTENFVKNSYRSDKPLPGLPFYSQ